MTLTKSVRKHPDIDIPDISLLPPTTQKIMDEIHEKIDEIDEVEAEIVEIDQETAMDTIRDEPIDKNGMKMVKFIPVDLEIAFDHMVDTIREKQVLYWLTKSISVELFNRSKPGKPHPQLLGYLKQMSEQLKDIHLMTEPEQDNVTLTKLKVVKMMMESREEISEDFKIMFLKELKARQAAREALIEE